VLNLLLVVRVRISANVIVLNCNNISECCVWFHKLWDPRDGSFVRSLRGHSNEVMSVRYSGSEQFLVSAGADSEILVWSLLTLSVVRRLLGHIDVVYG
jgi:WD40 repeat protein